MLLIKRKINKQSLSLNLNNENGLYQLAIAINQNLNRQSQSIQIPHIRKLFAIFAQFIIIRRLCVNIL